MDSGGLQDTAAASHFDSAKDVADRGPQTDNTLGAVEQLRQDMAKGMSDMRQEMLDMFLATLPKSSNWTDDGISPSRNPGSCATDLPEIASVASDTGIVGFWVSWFQMLSSLQMATVS